MAGFNELGVMPEIVHAIEDMEWMLPSDVQAEAIPLILGGGDVLMAAETGSGKTGAFCLPVLQIVFETLQEVKKPAKQKPAGATKLALNAYDRDAGFAISACGLIAQSRDEHAWQGARATLGVTSAGGKPIKAYYEAKVTDEGLCRIGWATASATRELGCDAQGFGFGGTGKKSHLKQFDEYGQSFGLDDVVGCYLDLGAGTIAWSKNGAHLGVAYTIPEAMRKSVFYPAVCLKNAELQFNFGAKPFAFPPKDGFMGLTDLQDALASGAVAPGAGASGGKKERTPLAVILEPSRELAEQTRDQIALFKKHLGTPIKEVLLIGGVNAKDQVKALQDGCDIVVATPGRLEDFISTGKIDLSQVRFYIMDEADGLISQGHTKLLENLYAQIPKESPDGKRLQLIVCSATLHSPDVQKLADKIMYHPTWIDLKGQDSVPETVHHTVVMVDPAKDDWWKNPTRRVKTDGVHAHENTKGNKLTPECLSEAVKVLKHKLVLAAIDKYAMDQAIIFCRTKLDCDNMEAFLAAVGGGPNAMVNGYSCTCLHSDKSVQERRDNLAKFKEGEVRFLICTDVAARGIDVKGIPYVINVTLPDEKENYIHRIGRVGRADRMGLAISLVSTVDEKVWYHSCPSKGKGCHNTRLKEDGGCTIWYKEKQYLADIEEHLGVSIPVIDEAMNIPVDEYDGKVVYGEKRKAAGAAEFKGHADLLAPSVRELAELEDTAQSSYFNLLKVRKM